MVPDEPLARYQVEDAAERGQDEVEQESRVFILRLTKSGVSHCKNPEDTEDHPQNEPALRGDGTFKALRRQERVRDPVLASQQDPPLPDNDFVVGQGVDASAHPLPLDEDWSFAQPFTHLRSRATVSDLRELLGVSRPEIILWLEPCVSTCVGAEPV